MDRIVSRLGQLVLIYALLAMGSGIPLSAQTSQSDSLAVVEVVDAYHQALVRADSATALRLLTTDAIVLESGGIETLEEYRSHHLEADIQFAQAITRQRGPIQVTVVGDVAWAVSSSETKGTWHGRSIDSMGAELMILSRSPSGWRISAIHWSSRSR